MHIAINTPLRRMSNVLQGKPTIKKALVVAPASLVRNWQAEIRKWLVRTTDA